MRARGDAALLEWSERSTTGGLQRVVVAGEAIGPSRAAPARCAGSAAAVEAVHAAQRPADTDRRAAPRARGRAPLAARRLGRDLRAGQGSSSSLVMTVGPGAGRRCAADRRRDAAARRPCCSRRRASSGSTRSTSIGGAQAIAALAYGTETIPSRSRRSSGRGTAGSPQAKLLVSGDVAIDLPAGPSEVARDRRRDGRPGVGAADLLAQAEHGPDGESILVTTSAALADEVVARTNGKVRIETVGLARSRASRARTTYAPEHLELLVADPAAARPGCPQRGRGLPRARRPSSATTQPARTTFFRLAAWRGAPAASGLEAFLRPVQFVRATRDGLAAVRGTVERFAELEGLPLHAAAVAVRC